MSEDLTRRALAAYQAQQAAEQEEARAREDMERARRAQRLLAGMKRALGMIVDAGAREADGSLHSEGLVFSAGSHDQLVKVQRQCPGCHTWNTDLESVGSLTELGGLLSRAYPPQCFTCTNARRDEALARLDAMQHDPCQQLIRALEALGFKRE